MFVCIENSARSQMAEGFARTIGACEFDIDSAGTNPADQVDPGAIKVMKEIGIDIADQYPKKLDIEDIRDADVMVTMGCTNENLCPAGFAPEMEDWNLEDPKGLPLDEYRRIRDDIEEKVKELIDRFGLGTRTEKEGE